MFMAKACLQANQSMLRKVISHSMHPKLVVSLLFLAKCTMSGVSVFSMQDILRILAAEMLDTAV